MKGPVEACVTVCTVLHSNVAAIIADVPGF